MPVVNGHSYADLTCCRNEAFDGRSVVGTRKLLVHRLGSLYDRHGEKILIDTSVPFQDLKGLFASCFLCQMRGVTLLPKELSRPNERHGVLEFPAHHVVPLVQLQRKVSVRLDLSRKVGVHGGLTRRANGDGFLEVGLSSLGDPRYFSGKTFHMLLLALQIVGANEDGEVGIADFQCFDLCVEPRLDVFPDGVTARFQNVATRDLELSISGEEWVLASSVRTS